MREGGQKRGREGWRRRGREKGSKGGRDREEVKEIHYSEEREGKKDGYGKGERERGRAKI